jgi:tetratricopeptide (TPR) repeat protein
VRRAARAGYGSVARRGAAEVRKPGPPRDPQERGRPARAVEDEWIDEGSVRKPASRSTSASTKAPGAPSGRRRASERLPEDVLQELAMAAGVKRAPRLSQRLAEARENFEHERYADARRILAPLAKEAPAATAVRELLGLTYYRLERWKQAIGELEAYITLTGSREQHPVLADCYRALGRHQKVEELWDELGSSSPSADIVNEGRIVMAGSFADQGRLAAAIAVMEKGLKPTKRVLERHMRHWYALADLYDRAGDVPRAKSLFKRLQQEDPNFADVNDRLAALGR